MRKVNRKEYYKTKVWEDRARQCYKNAGDRCQVCNSLSSLDAHHRTYVRLGNELQSDLIALCRYCHTVITAMQRGLIDIGALEEQLNRPGNNRRRYRRRSSIDHRDAL